MRNLSEAIMYCFGLYFVALIVFLIWFYEPEKQHCSDFKWIPPYSYITHNTCTGDVIEKVHEPSKGLYNLSLEKNKVNGI